MLKAWIKAFKLLTISVGSVTSNLVIPASIKDGWAKYESAKTLIFNCKILVPVIKHIREAIDVESRLSLAHNTSSGNVIKATASLNKLLK